jgi:hypothetical protein
MGSQAGGDPRIAGPVGRGLKRVTKKRCFSLEMRRKERFFEPKQAFFDVFCLLISTQFCFLSCLFALICARIVIRNVGFGPQK